MDYANVHNGKERDKKSLSLAKTEFLIDTNEIIK